jgi:hypothetical protein
MNKCRIQSPEPALARLLELVAAELGVAAAQIEAYGLSSPRLAGPRFLLELPGRSTPSFALERLGAAEAEAEDMGVRADPGAREVAVVEVEQPEDPRALVVLALAEAADLLAVELA